MSCELISTIAIPGPTGPTGPAGTDGTDGSNAFTLVANYSPGTQPVMPFPIQHFAGTLTNGSPIVAFGDTSTLVAGMFVGGAGVPAGASIQSVDSAIQFTLTVNATASGASIMVFTAPVTVNTTTQTTFLATGEKAYVEGWGTMSVYQVLTNSVILTNPKDVSLASYLTNAAQGTVLPAGNKVVPGGEQGALGAAQSGAFAIVNNLSEGTPTAMRASLVLGTVAVLNQGVVNGRVPIIDTNFNPGQVLFSTPTGLQSVTSNAARPLLGLAIGTNVQAWNATLSSLAALGTGADRIAYTTGVNTWAEATLTAFAQSLIAATDASTARAVLGITSVSTLDYLLYRQVVGSGIGGGVLNAAGWRTVPLNTKVVDQGGHGSIAANQVTLAAGTYRYKFSANAGGVAGLFQGRLYNITNAVVVTDGYGSSGGDTNVLNNIKSIGEGRFTIGGTIVFELQIFSAGTGNFGVASNTGAPENYSTIEFWRE